MKGEKRHVHARTAMQFFTATVPRRPTRESIFHALAYVHAVRTPKRIGAPPVGKAS
jgi:hypothetical protein